MWETESRCILSDDAESPKQGQIHGRRNRPRASDQGFPTRARRPRAARGERQGNAVAVAPQPRFFQARSQEAPRAVSAHDPSTGRYLCGATGRREGSIACKEGGVKSEYDGSGIPLIPIVIDQTI